MNITSGIIASLAQQPTRAAVRSNAAVSSIAASAGFQARAWTLSEWCFRVAWHCAVFRSQILADASADALASTDGAAGFHARPRTASVWLPGCNAYTAGATSADCSFKGSYYENPASTIKCYVSAPVQPEAIFKCKKGKHTKTSEAHHLICRCLHRAFVNACNLLIMSGN